MVLLTIARLSLAQAQAVDGETTGTIIDFAPGSSIAVKDDSGELVRLTFAKAVTIANANGKEIPIYKLKRGRKVRMHWIKSGNDSAVDKVTLLQE